MGAVNQERTDERVPNGSADGARLANALGWFSIGLGLAQLTAPRRMARMIGVEDHSGSRGTLRALGLREVTSGVGMLRQPRTPGWAWGRVAGDVMDIALLQRASAAEETRRGRARAATAAVLGVTALDVFCGQQLTRANTTGVAGAAARDKGVRLEKSITVNLPPEEVYRFWHNFENLPRFMRHLESVEVTGDGRSHWKAKAPAGMNVEWDAEITEDRPGELIAWRSVGGSTVENTGSVRFTPAPGGRGTEVHVNVRYSPPGGVVTDKLAKLFREEPGQQIQDDLRTFKQVMETGEVLVSDASLTRGPHAAQLSGAL